MKKIIPALLALMLLTTPALALPDGPEGDILGQGYFEISVSEKSSPPPGAPLPLDTYENERFYFADGWDFGDRVAYKCAWAEFYQGTNEKFEVHYEQVAPYPHTVIINDRYGVEVNGDEGIAPLCGEGTSSTGPVLAFDGTDHFPHLVHPGDGIDIYQDGEVIQHVELALPTCSKSYWVPGDQPGEAWLWWDEDGPTFAHSETEGELPCGGGPGEPIVATRITVQNADPDIGYCTVSLHESQCFNVEPPPTPVTLGAGASILTCPDGSTPAVQTTEPLLVRC